MQNLTDVSTHYEFGENWRKYAGLINDQRISAAERGLAKLLTREELAGRTFLDIGCGSGLHSLAAARAGVAAITAIDLDPNSVATTKAVLTRFAPTEVEWQAMERSVFDLDSLPLHDVVYSWGVLHHTGAMERAISAAAARVRPGGLFAIALYRKTPLCGFWRIEKKLYTQGGPAMRGVLETLYNGARGMSFWLRGRSFKAYKADYAALRGMEYMTDVRDWLGGYPYESISKPDMLAIADALGFDFLRGDIREKPGSGLLGSGCDEYVFRKR
jgi:SAM-dependent methyltransferase